MTQAVTGDAGAQAPARARKNWSATFIATLAETSNVTAAARAANISPSRAYRCRREDPAFAKAWFAALCEGYDALEMDLLYRLRTGKTEETGEDGSKRKFDIATAFKCLIAHRETVSREKARTGEEDETTILASIEAKIDALRRCEREQRTGDTAPAAPTTPAAKEGD